MAYAGRRLRAKTIAEKGKYVFPKGFHKSLELYNLHRARQSAPEYGLIVVEGFFGAITLTERGIPNVVALMGSTASTAQLNLLATAQEVTLMLDGDDAGRAGAAAIEEALTGRTVVRTVDLPTPSEPEDFSLRTLRWLVRGMRELHLTRVSFKEQPRRGVL